MARHRPRHAAPAERSPWRPVALAAVAAVALAASVGGVYAVLQANATATQTATTGTLLLTQTGSTSTAIANAAPGDTAQRFVTLTNAGTLVGAKLTASITSPNPNELSNGAALTALRVSIVECSQPWTVTPTAGTCGGTTTTTSVVDRPVPFTGLTLAPADLPAGALRHLRIAFLVPDNNETSTNGSPPPNSVQGKTTTLTLTFAEEQLTGKVTTS